MSVSVWLNLLHLFILLLIGFIQLVDISIITFPDSMLDEKINEGNYQFILIKKLMQKPNYYKSAVHFSSIFLIVLSSLLFYHSSYIYSFKLFLIEILGFHTFSYDVILIFLLLLYIVIIDIFFINIPRQIGMHSYKKITEHFTVFIYVVCFLVYPFVVLSEKMSTIINKLFKLTKTATKSVTEEEIRLMMDIGAQKGAIQTEEKQMIENVFEFNNIVAEDIMTHRTDVHAININDTNDIIIDTIKSSGYSRFPIYDEEIDNIVGILSARRFFLNLHSYPQKSLKEIMYPPYIVPVSIPADLLFRNMQVNKNHLAIIVDEYGGFNGIVTMEDLIEEILGNIYDENDFSEDYDIIRIHKNLWKIHGSTDIETINQTLGTNIPPNENYDTLNGMVFDALSLIPEDGSKFDIELFNLNIQVKKIIDHRIISALVSKKNPS